MVDRPGHLVAEIANVGRVTMVSPPITVQCLPRMASLRKIFTHGAHVFQILLHPGIGCDVMLLERICLNVIYLSSLAHFVAHLVKLLLLNIKIRKSFAYSRKRSYKLA